MSITPDVGAVSIRPEVTVLSVLKHLNYQPWFAMAEFIDNALQSYLSYRDELRAVEGDSYRLRVQIRTDGDRVSIYDNAAGIHEHEYGRAFRPAAVPPDNTGLSEFGMGMKSAACWFANRWSVRTKALYEEVERTVPLDVEAIVRDGIEHLSVKTRPAKPTAHYTEVQLQSLHRPLYGRTIGKIKDHRASIYRVYLQQNELEIIYDGEALSYDPPEILVASHFKDPTGEPVTWRKEISFDFGSGCRATGFAALRARGSTSRAGFALFRRNRLIQGSGENSYRPEAIFRRSNSYTYQRLFGELHLEGFEVSHTKDGFRWEDSEEAFLDLLKDELNDDGLPLLDQAEGYRSRPERNTLQESAEAATDRTAQAVERHVPGRYESLLATEQDVVAPPAELPVTVPLAVRTISVNFDDQPWEIAIELAEEPGMGEWLEMCDQLVERLKDSKDDVRRLGIRLALGHPFMERFAGADDEKIEPLLRVAVALALAETAVRDGGWPEAVLVRDFVNDLLRDSLAQP